MAGGSAFPNSNYNQSQGNPFSQGYGAPMYSQPPTAYGDFQNQMQMPQQMRPMMGGMFGGLDYGSPQHTPFNPQYQNQMQQAYNTRRQFEQSDAYKNFMAKQQALQQEFEGSEDFKNFNTQMKQYEPPRYDSDSLQKLHQLSQMMRGIQF